MMMIDDGAGDGDGGDDDGLSMIVHSSCGLRVLPSPMVVDEQLGF